MWAHFPVPGLWSPARFLLSLGLLLLVSWMGTISILGSAGGFNGVTYLNVSHGVGYTGVTPPMSVPLPKIPAVSSASLWNVQAKTAAQENSWTALFIYTARRLKSLCFDWQQLLIGLVPSELLGSGLSPTKLPTPGLGHKLHGCLCGPLLPNHVKAESLPCSIKWKSLPTVNKEGEGRGQRKPSQNDGVELGGRSKGQHPSTQLCVLSLRRTNYGFHHRSWICQRLISPWVLGHHSKCWWSTDSG